MDWRTEPGILRTSAEDLAPHERDAVRELIAVHPQEFEHDTTMFDRLVRMQHFGLPTRLLDVTANPLVALFNATDDTPEDDGRSTDGKVVFFTVPRARKKYFDSDTVSCIANLANLSDAEKRAMTEKDLPIEQFNRLPSVDRLLQFIKAEKPFFRPQIRSDDLNRLWYVVPKLSNPRIIAQRGAFLIFGLDVNRNVESDEPIEFDSIVIDRRKKREIRAQLDTLGINKSGLFPEIDKTAEDIVNRLRLKVGAKRNEGTPEGGNRRDLVRRSARHDTPILPGCFSTRRP